VAEGVNRSAVTIKLYPFWTRPPSLHLIFQRYDDNQYMRRPAFVFEAATKQDPCFIAKARSLLLMRSTGVSSMGPSRASSRTPPGFAESDVSKVDGDLARLVYLPDPRLQHGTLRARWTVVRFSESVAETVWLRRTASVFASPGCESAQSSCVSVGTLHRSAGRIRMNFVGAWNCRKGIESCSSQQTIPDCKALYLER